AGASPVGRAAPVGAGNLPADLVRALLAAVLVQVGDDDGGACRRECPRGRLAEPARAAGYDRRSTVELHVREHTRRGSGTLRGQRAEAPAGPPVCSLLKIYLVTS